MRGYENFKLKTNKRPCRMKILQGLFLPRNKDKGARNLVKWHFSAIYFSLIKKKHFKNNLKTDESYYHVIKHKQGGQRNVF